MDTNIPIDNQRYKVATSFLKVLLFLLVLWYAGNALYNSFLLVDWSYVRFHFTLFILGGLVLSGTCLAGTIAYRNIYHAIGSKLSFSKSFVLLTVPPVGKYLPGKVLAIAGHAAIAKSFGVSLKASGTAIILIMAIGLSAATLLGTILVSMTSYLGVDIGVLYPYLYAVIISVIFFHPRIFLPVLNFLLRLIKQSPIKVDLSFIRIIFFFFSLLLQTGLYISGTVLMAFGLLAIPTSFFPAVVGASCLANVAGFLALFAPAGIGVREGILLFMLTPTLGAGTASILVLLIRLFQTAADFILAGIGYLVFKRNT